MADPPFKASSYSPRSHLSPHLVTHSPLSVQAWAWKSTSPALGARRGLYAGRRGSFTLEEPLLPSPSSSPPPSSSSSPKRPPINSVPVLPLHHTDDQLTSSPLSPRKGTTLPKCLSAEHIELPRFRRGSTSESVPKHILKVFKKDDAENHDQGDHTTTTTTTSPAASTPPSSPTALNGQPTSPTGSKLKPLIRIDSMNSCDEPAHVRKLRDDVKPAVTDLIRARKLYALESVTSFYMKDSKHGKYTKRFIQLTKNHQVVQFGDSDTVAGEFSDIYFPLKIPVSNLSLVEDRSPKDPTLPPSDSIPAGFHIWFFDKVHRGEYDLITSNEYDFVAWFEGLKALVGATIEAADGPTVKMLTDLEVDMQLYHMDVNEAKLFITPPVPKPLSESFSAKKQEKGKEDDEGGELWRRCYAELPNDEDCFNFASYQHPLFIS